jgi:hypothetical protein
MMSKIYFHQWGRESLADTISAWLAWARPESYLRLRCYSISPLPLVLLALLI